MTIYSKPHILVVALFIYFPAVFANAINEPRFIETDLFAMTKDASKLINSGLKSGEFASQATIDVIRPLRSDRINFAHDL